MLNKWLCIFLCCTCMSAFAEKEDRTAAAQANARLGIAYLNKGYVAISQQRLMLAIQEDRDNPEVWYSMGYFLEKTNQPVEAGKYYRHAISVDPHSGSAENNYGSFLCRTGHYQEGIAEFMAAIQEKTYLDAPQAYENAGICSLMMHNHRLALSYFYKAVGYNPNMPFSLLSIARLSHQSGDDQTAQKYFMNFALLMLHKQSKAVVDQYHDYVFNAPMHSVAYERKALPTP